MLSEGAITRFRKEMPWLEGVVGPLDQIGHGQVGLAEQGMLLTTPDWDVLSGMGTRVVVVNSFGKILAPVPPRLCFNNVRRVPDTLQPIFSSYGGVPIIALAAQSREAAYIIVLTYGPPNKDSDHPFAFIVYSIERGLDLNQVLAQASSAAQKLIDRKLRDLSQQSSPVTVKDHLCVIDLMQRIRFDDKPEDCWGGHTTPVAMILHPEGEATDDLKHGLGLRSAMYGEWSGWLLDRHGNALSRIPSHRSVNDALEVQKLLKANAPVAAYLLGRLSNGYGGTFPVGHIYALSRELSPLRIC